MSMRVPHRTHLGPAIAFGAALTLVACDHGGAYAPAGPQNAGPSSTETPRRLTYYPLTDRTPSVFGDQIIFARQSDAERSDFNGIGREECMAIMPLEGGTIQTLRCPDRLLPAPDTLVDNWSEAAISPDGTRVAYMWQRAVHTGILGYVDAYLMVNPVDRPQDMTGIRRLVSYFEGGPAVNPRRADVATRIRWLDDAHLRFLATFEYFYKVKGGGAERVSETTLVALTIMDFDLTSGAMQPVPGADSAIAWTPSPDGVIWMVREPDSTLVLRLDPATGVRTPVGNFTAPASDLIALGGDPVAIVDGGGAIERLDLATGTTRRLTGFAGPVQRIIAAGGNRFVAQIEQGTVLFGAPTDLWLLDLP